MFLARPPGASDRMITAASRPSLARHLSYGDLTTLYKNTIITDANTNTKSLITTKTNNSDSITDTSTTLYNNNTNNTTNNNNTDTNKNTNYTSNDTSSSDTHNRGHATTRWKTRSEAPCSSNLGSARVDYVSL